MAKNQLIANFASLINAVDDREVSTRTLREAAALMELGNASESISPQLLAAAVSQVLGFLEVSAAGLDPFREFLEAFQSERAAHPLALLWIKLEESRRLAESSWDEYAGCDCDSCRR